VLSFFDNSTQANHNLARKKSIVPQDYSASVIPCGKRGAESQNLTNSELWTIYNFTAKISIYNVKREYRAMPVPVLGDAVPVLVLVLVPGETTRRDDAGRDGAGERLF